MPTGNIDIDTFHVGQVETTCMANPVCPLVLGNIPGARPSGTQTSTGVGLVL